MSDMPLLAIEVLSPTPTIGDILAKFKAYLALGVKSCWLVTPLIKAITIYSQPSHFKTFGTLTLWLPVYIELMSHSLKKYSTV